MVKASDIGKLTSTNFWTWKPDARALLLAEGLWNTLDPAVPVPTGATSLCNWTNESMKAYGLIYLTLSPAVQAKVNNAGIPGSNGRLLWAQLETYYNTADVSTRSILMSQLTSLTHDLSLPADTFMQAAVTAQNRLTAIAVSIPEFMVCDKILGGLSSTYSAITAVLQNESPQRDIADMIAVINAWELADLQKPDSAIARAQLENHGGATSGDPITFAACRHLHQAPSRSMAGREFDWMNTKNRTDVCYRCGLPGHFAQYCVSSMPDDVRHRILRDHEENARAAVAAEAGDSPPSTEYSLHATSTVLDLPHQLNTDTMNPTVLAAWYSTTPHAHKSDFAHAAAATTFDRHNIDSHSPPPSPTLTASSVSSSPEKKKKKKKKKKAEVAAPIVEEDGNHTEYSI